jgi:hypothetical protein
MLKDDATYMLTDLLSGDNNVLNLLEKHNLKIQDIERAYKLIKNNPNLDNKDKDFYINNSWKINFKMRPPMNIQEFLTPEWIGEMDVYSHVGRSLETFFDPNAKHRNLILSPCIGWGKSTMGVLASMYLISNLACMRNPRRFLPNCSVMTSLSVVFGSFTLAQSSRLLKKPFYNLMKASPKFKRVKQEDQIEIYQEEEIKKGTNRIVWSTASKMEGIFSVSNDINGVLISDPYALLGLTIVIGILSELSFFLDKGVSADNISRFYNDLKGRIWSRFKGHYYGRTIMDSSPNTFMSPIDRYVFSGEAEKDESNMVVTSTHWEVFGQDYEIYGQTGETFSIYRGSGGKPTCEIKDDKEKDKYLPEEIIDVPIDLFQMYQDNPNKIVKDYCGYPSEGDDKLITNYDIIEDMFDPQLKNIIDSIKAPAVKRPELLIWNQIVDKFFIKISTSNYNFYRASREKRYFAVDQSESGDATGICMLHPELDNKGEIVIVVDFNIIIVPDKYKINLEAIYYFITELKYKGGINFAGIYFDRYESSQTINRLQREDFPAGKFSVDINKGAYLTLISWIKNNRVKAGRNIFIKNNLKSLKEVELKNGRTKVEHTKGKNYHNYDGNWKLSFAGINAKDGTDPLASAFYNCINNYKGVPQYQWIDSDDPSFQDIQKESLNKLLKNIGYKSV